MIESQSVSVVRQLKKLETAKTHGFEKPKPVSYTLCNVDSYSVWQYYIQFLCGVYLMDMQVILGGGRKYMYPKETPDVEYPNEKQHYGTRKDGRNLIDEWKERMKEKASDFLCFFFLPPSVSHLTNCLCFPTWLELTTAVFISDLLFYRTYSPASEVDDLADCSAKAVHGSIHLASLLDLKKNKYISDLL